MTDTGDTGIGFQLRITSLNVLQPEKNIGYSEAFSAFLKEKIGVDNNRGYILFHGLGELTCWQNKLCNVSFLPVPLLKSCCPICVMTD